MKTIIKKAVQTARTKTKAAIRPTTPTKSRNPIAYAAMLEVLG